MLLVLITAMVSESATTEPSIYLSTRPQRCRSFQTKWIAQPNNISNCHLASLPRTAPSWETQLKPRKDCDHQNFEKQKTRRRTSSPSFSNPAGYMQRESRFIGKRSKTMVQQSKLSCADRRKRFMPIPKRRPHRLSPSIQHVKTCVIPVRAGKPASISNITDDRITVHLNV